MSRRAKILFASTTLGVWLGGAFGALATPPVPPILPQDPAVYAEWVCYPLRRALAFGACGCGFPGACGDRAPAGCYCDARCVDEGDCCLDADLFCGGVPEGQP